MERRERKEMKRALKNAAAEEKKRSAELPKQKKEVPAQETLLGATIKNALLRARAIKPEESDEESDSLEENTHPWEYMSPNQISRM